MQVWRLAATAVLVCAPLAAQFGIHAAPDVMLVGHFRTPLSYQELLTRLDSYYQEQVGHPLPVAFPQLAPNVHYETWHDMWVSFAADGAWLNVTLKRPTDAATGLLAKGWMLQIAGRTGGELPVRFEELPALHTAQGEIYGSRRDVAQALAAQPELRLLTTWQHAGLLVSPAPLTRIELEPAGTHGVHHFNIQTESAVAAKQLAAKLSAYALPCICAAYSETAEIEEELHNTARQQAGDATSSTAQKVYLSNVDPQVIEDKLRADPAMQKRLAAASGWLAIRYRVDKAHPKVHIRWSELTGYSRETGKFEAEHPLGASTAVNVRPLAPPSAQVTGRTRVEPPKPGAYRVVLEGETAAGQKVPIDQRDYWFDGKTFEEL